jgi:hypothetical protein
MLSLPIYSFALDTNKNVLTPKNPNITSLGGNKLTNMDLMKIRKAYGCCCDDMLVDV